MSAQQSGNEPPPPEAAATAPCQLHITIPRTRDTRRDRERVERVSSLATNDRGKDRFSFCIQDGEGHVRCDFPAHSTDNCVELQQQLMQMLGATAVRVAPCDTGAP